MNIVSTPSSFLAGSCWNSKWCSDMWNSEDIGCPSVNQSSRPSAPRRPSVCPSVHPSTTFRSGDRQHRCRASPDAGLRCMQRAASLRLLRLWRWLRGVLQRTEGYLASDDGELAPSRRVGTVGRLGHHHQASRRGRGRGRYRCYLCHGMAVRRGHNSSRSISRSGFVTFVVAPYKAQFAWILPQNCVPLPLRAVRGVLGFRRFLSSWEFGRREIALRGFLVESERFWMAILAAGATSANQIASSSCPGLPGSSLRWRSGQIGARQQQPRAAAAASLLTSPDDGREFFNGRRTEGSVYGGYDARQSSTRCHCWSSQKAQGQEKKNGYPTAGYVPYVTWFREAWPYIQGHRGSTFVIVIPGEIVENRSALESILQVRHFWNLYQKLQTVAFVNIDRASRLTCVCVVSCRT